MQQQFLQLGTQLKSTENNMRYQVGHDSFQVDSSLTAEELKTTEETAIRRGEQCDLVVLAVRAEQQERAGQLALDLSQQ